MPQPARKAANEEGARARDADLGYRILGASFLSAGSVWVALAITLAIKHRVSVAAAIVLGVIGGGGAIALRVVFGRRRRTMLARYINSATGKLEVPGGQLPLPNNIRLLTIGLIPVEVIVIALVAAAQK